ncbi:MAG: hypothetical protein GY720_19415 [bacterium]|nr:hypothetical protein [bacterium]
MPLSQGAALATADSVPSGSVATQSSTNSGGSASRAIDNDVSGYWDLDSVTHTSSENEAWWQVDMQSIIAVNEVRIWNRTDCCGDRLSDFYLFVSDLPFASTDVATTVADSNVTSLFHSGAAPNYLTMAPGVTGRYLRIQLTGTDYLSLAEVQVNTDALSALADETWGVANRSRSLISGTEAEVFAIEQIGNTIYVGGKYNNVVRRRVVDPQVDQPFLAAFDATTGDYIDFWTPEVNGPVYALEAAPDGSRLYVGGEFTEVNGHPDTRGLVALDPVSGMIDHTWFAMVENFYADDPGVVRDIEVSEGWIYIAGNFSHVQGIDPSSRRFVYKVARISPTTGAPDTSWLPKVQGGPNAGGGVRGLAHDPVRDRVYLAGYFETVNSVSPTDRFAAVSDVDGSTILGLNRFPELTPNQDHQFDVVVHGDYVWVAGTQHLVHMLNASDLSINRRWFTGFEGGFHIGGDYQALAIVGDQIYATCHCWGVIRDLPNSVDTLTEARNIQPLDMEAQGVMAFDLVTGDLDESWLPDTFGSIGGWALHGGGDSCLWIGGDFNRRQVGDQWRNSLQRYCPETGQGPPVGPPLTQQPPPETNPPSVPGGFTATDNGDNSVDMTWSASTDDTAVMYYRIYRNGVLLQATRGLSLTDLGATPGDTYTVRAVDAYETESADSAVETPVLAGLTDYILNVTFDGGDEGFTYADDVFRSTSEPGYADGILRRHGGDVEGNLMVKLGGYDQDDIFDMSGAWETTINLPQAMDVEVTFDWRLSVHNSNENSEYGEALFAVDGTLYGNGGDDYLDHIPGGGDSGWTTTTKTLSLSAGNHTLSFGGFHNQKTTKTETVEVSFDEITVAPTSPFVGFTSPAEGAILTGIVPMELRATDLDDASSQIDVEVSSNAGVSWDPAVWNAGTQRFDFTLDVSAMPDGPLDLMARATDTDNEVTTVTTPFLVDNDGDPTIVITDPGDGANVTGVVTVKIDANDPEDPAGTLLVEVSTDGATWNAATWNAGQVRYDYDWDTSANGDGPATIEARVTDSAPATVYATPVNVTVISAPGTDYGDTVVNDGATVFWRLGESAGTTAVDEIGGNDATYIGSPGLGATAVIASANTSVDFDGVDDRINITNSAEINQGGPYQTKTIELWFNADDVTNRQVLMEQGSIARGLNIYLDGGRLYAGAYNTNNAGGDTPWGPIFVSTPVATDTIYHAVMVIDQPTDTLSLYVNGALAASAPGVGDLHNHGLAAIGGQRGWARFHTGAQNGDLNYFDGTLDEVAVYATALSGGTVATHYAVGTSTSTEPSISIVAPTNGSTVSGVYTVVLNATDPDDALGTLLVEVRTDGATWNTATWNGALSRYEYLWDTSINGDGPATVEARVTDMTPTTVTATPANVTVFTPPAADYAATVVTDGATVYWRLGDSAGTTVVDDIGGNDATYIGSPTLGAPGIITGTDTAVSFDGVDDRINITNSAEINQGGPYQTKTIELWFNADSVTTRQVLMEQGSIARGLNIYLDGGSLYAGAYNTNNQGGDTPWGPVWISTAVSAGTDYHVVFVIDQPTDTLSLYVNGGLAASDIGVGDLHNHGLSAIGAQRDWARFHTGAQNGDLNYFEGTIDEVAVYGTALDATTVAVHYAAGIS